MLRFTGDRKYKPSEVSRILTEDFGHKVTPSVIRKWDNCILADLIKQREKGIARNYSQQDIELFNAIAVLRNLGYSLDETKSMMADIVMRKGDDVVKIEIKAHMDKQRRGLESLDALLKSKPGNK